MEKERKVQSQQLTAGISLWTRQAPMRTARHGVDGEPNLVPGVRDRLQARLAALGIPEHKTVSHVAKLTYRAAQSVRRWFDPKTPGLPDLESFARLCAGLGCSADEIIGANNEAAATSLQDRRFAEIVECVQSMADVLSQHGSLNMPLRVLGDEMAPYLLEGDLIFVDSTANHLTGNGVYALECGGKLIIRRVEQRLGDGFVLKCDNHAYSDSELIQNTATAKRLGIQVIGKVHGAISARTL
jgi:hypothetical protein